MTVLLWWIWVSCASNWAAVASAGARYTDPRVAKDEGGLARAVDVLLIYLKLKSNGLDYEKMTARK